MAPMAPSDQPTPLDLSHLDAWLVRQRWFRSRTRELREVTVHDSIELSGEPSLLVVRALFADGGEERYLVPIVGATDGPREVADGDGVWRTLLGLLADGPQTLSGRHGGLVLEPEPSLETLLPGGRGEAGSLSERAMGAEQSNTSIRLGDRLVLKIYRLLEPGLNPEVEVLAFLTERGFSHAPQAAGSMRYVADDAEPASAGIAQSLVPASGDAWHWMLDHLRGPTAEPREALLAASRIGAVTGGLHDALQSAPDRPEFPSRAATSEERQAWRAGAEAQLAAAADALDDEQRKRISRLADAVRAAFAAITDAPGARISRIHGDYHLGQLLVTDDGFVITDFEGEPARPIDERRRPASPLRDVAGMLRSLDYAARTAQRRQPEFDGGGWLDAARGALLTAYGDAANPALLRAFELEKACYEVRYEANFRPDWTWLPLEAIERMVA
jgi:trehalose synthase-fused probable maltokinase